jgi:hypothetical protein
MAKHLHWNNVKQHYTETKNRHLVADAGFFIKRGLHAQYGEHRHEQSENGANVLKVSLFQGRDEFLQPKP